MWSSLPDKPTLDCGQTIRQHYNYLFKILLIGDVGTGKSCMRLQLIEKRLPQIYEKTNSIEYAAKTIDVANKKIKLEIWDYGEDAFRETLRPSEQPPNCIGVMLVFSITNRQSFRAAHDWLQYQRMHYNPFCKVILIGNKADESYKRTVFKTEADALAAHHSIPYRQISSAQYSEVSQLFMELAKWIYSDVQQGKIPMNYQKYGVREINHFLSGLSMADNPRTRKANCC